MATNAKKADDSLRKVLKNLNGAIADVKNGTNAGLRTLAIKIERGSKKKVPREYGNLVNSGYHKKVEGEKFEVGFTAEYAVHVHENVEMKLKGKKRPSGKGVYWGPKGEARYLAKAIEDEVPTAAATVAAEAKVKGKSK